MRVQRHLLPEQREVLRDVVARHRPEALSFLDDLYNRSLRLHERAGIARAIICDMYQRGHERDDFSDLWNLHACINLRCTLADYQFSLLERVIAPSDSNLAATIQERDSVSWTDEERESYRKAVFREWIARKKRREVGRNERTEIGHLLWRLRSHVYADTTLHPDDFTVFRDVIAKWIPQDMHLLNNLGEDAVAKEDRHNLYDAITDAITAEMQNGDGADGVYGGQLDGLIDYIGSLPSVPD